MHAPKRKMGEINWERVADKMKIGAGVNDNDTSFSLKMASPTFIHFSPTEFISVKWLCRKKRLQLALIFLFGSHYPYIKELCCGE